MARKEIRQRFNTASTGGPVLGALPISPYGTSTFSIQGSAWFQIAEPAREGP